MFNTVLNKAFGKNAMVGQSGGPTAAINATLSGVIRRALESPHIDSLYGMRNGVEGLLEEKTVKLDAIFENGEDKLRLLEQTPAAYLGSCRKKLPDPSSSDIEDIAVYEKLFGILKKLDIGYFFYIGGNDSMDTVAKMTLYAERKNIGIRIIGVPKTIDNDLCATDHAPGYGSAAKYIAAVTQEIIRDCAVYTVKAVTIIEIMGRDAGWLCAASALGRRVNGVSPDLVYLAEAEFDINRFLDDVARAFEKHPNVVVAVSEGARLANGRYVGESTQNGSIDIFGHRYLGGTGNTLADAVKQRFSCKVRSVELNLPQRCAAHILSATDIEESVRIGRAAVDAALEGVSGEMMLFERTEGREYSCIIKHDNIFNIANSARPVPRKFINAEGNNVTDECLEYLAPLIQGEYPVIFEGGIPKHIYL